MQKQPSELDGQQCLRKWEQQENEQKDWTCLHIRTRTDHRLCAMPFLTDQSVVQPIQSDKPSASSISQPRVSVYPTIEPIDAIIPIPLFESCVGVEIGTSETIDHCIERRGWEECGPSGEVFGTQNSERSGLDIQ